MNDERYNELRERLNAAKERGKQVHPTKPVKQQTWTSHAPFYVTRPNSRGVIASHSAPVWAITLATTLIMLNVISWGIYGLVELVLKVVG